MNAYQFRLHLAFVTGLFTIIFALLVLAGSAVRQASAGPAHPRASIVYVAVTGANTPTCGGLASPCATIQYALDHGTAGDEIRVAAGTYTGVQARPRADVIATGSVTQVVYISKTITIRGGYTPAFTDPPAPESNRTILNAQGGGRVVYVTSSSPVVLEGIELTGGNAANLGGGSGGADAGGGLYAYQSGLSVHAARVWGNTALAGGGVYLYNSPATLAENTMSSNTARDGGGLYLIGSTVTLSGTAVTTNTASTRGGGVYLYLGNSMALIGNRIAANSAITEGGGLYLSSSNATFNGNTIARNSAGQRGGAAYLLLSNPTFTNTVIVDNQSAGGSGLYLSSSSPRLLHTTLAHNLPGDGVGLYVSLGTPVLTNTILVSHTIGIYVSSIGGPASLQATLWGSGAWANKADSGGSGVTITGTVNVRGNPGFIAPSAGNYHIGSASAARDAGINAGVTTDLDGHPRPVNGLYDIGAYEYIEPQWNHWCYVPVVRKQS